METFLALEARNLIGKFTPQHDATRDATCKAAKIAAELTVDVALQVTVAGSTYGQYRGAVLISQLAVDRLYDIAKHSTDPAAWEKYTNAAQRLNFVKNYMYYHQYAVGNARKGKEVTDTITDAHHVAKGSSAPDRDIGPPRLEHPVIPGRGVCGNAFGVIPDNAGSQTDLLIQYIASHMVMVRHYIEQVFRSFFGEENEELGFEPLMTIMNFDGLTTQRKKTQHELNRFELTQSFTSMSKS